MPRFRLLAPALFVLSAACGPAEEAPPSFATDQPRFFQGLNLLSDDTRTAFPDFERRWDRIAQDTIARLEAGEIVEEKEQKSAAQALLYAAFALVAGQHACRGRGNLRPAEVLWCDRRATRRATTWTNSERGCSGRASGSSMRRIGPAAMVPHCDGDSLLYVQLADD